MRSMHHNEGGEMGSVMGSRRDRRMNSNGAQHNGTTDLKETQVSQCSRHVMLFHHNHPIDLISLFQKLKSLGAHHIWCISPQPPNWLFSLFLPTIPDLEQLKFLQYKRLQKSLQKEIFYNEVTSGLDVYKPELGCCWWSWICQNMHS